MGYKKNVRNAIFYKQNGTENEEAYRGIDAVNAIKRFSLFDAIR